MLAGQAESMLSRYALALLSVFASAFAFAPLIFLRYDFHDSWAFLYIVNGAKVYRPGVSCIVTHEHSYLIGRPLAPIGICALTAVGPLIGLLWVPKLQAFLALLASGGILAAELRRAGANAAVAALCVVSLLFLPGTMLMVAHMAANPIAFGVLAAAGAGALWVRRLRRPAATRRGRAGWIALCLALLVVAMAIYQIVATVFFAPILIALLFAREPEGRAAFRFALGAVTAFAVAAALYLALHHTLLYGFHYFFLAPEHVAGISSTMRSASVHVGVGHLVEKIRFLGTLLPQIGTLWFVSEWHFYSLPAAIAAAGGIVLAGAALLVRRAGGAWRLAAVAVVVAAVFAPYFASDNAGNRIYPYQRVRMYLQMPVILMLWWLVHLLLERRHFLPRVAAGGAMAAACAGVIVSYLLMMRTYVIPNVMELKHVEYRVRDAVRRGIRHIYIIMPEREHLRAIYGIAGHNEFATLTTANNPLHMVTAILTEIQQRRPTLSTIPVAAEKGDTIAPAPDRLILDMRRFP